MELIKNRNAKITTEQMQGLLDSITGLAQSVDEETYDELLTEMLSFDWTKQEELSQLRGRLIY
jgi:hypothetical protein